MILAIKESFKHVITKLIPLHLLKTGPYFFNQTRMSTEAVMCTETEMDETDLKSLELEDFEVFKKLI